MVLVPRSISWREDQDRAPVGVGVRQGVGHLLAVGPGPGEPLAGQRGPTAVTQQSLEAVAVPGLDTGRGVQGRPPPGKPPCCHPSIASTSRRGGPVGVPVPPPASSRENTPSITQQW